MAGLVALVTDIPQLPNRLDGLLNDVIVALARVDRFRDRQGRFPGCAINSRFGSRALSMRFECTLDVQKLHSRRPTNAL